MTTENFERPESITNRATENRLSLSLSSFNIDDIRQLNKSASDPKDGTVHPLHLEDSDKKSEKFVRADKAESEEQRQDKLIKSAFGKDVFDNIKNQAWLNEHADALRKGFNSVFDRNHEFTAAQIAGRMKELSGGLIYGHISQGSKNPFGSDSSHPDEHFNVYVKKDYWFDTEVFHQTTTHSGTSERTSRQK